MSTRTAKGQAALERRIRSFYKHLNQQNVAACYQMIDPQVRDRPDSVTLYQYGSALHEFMDRVGALKLLAVHVTLHVDEPSRLYQGRDFAIGKAMLADSDGNQYVFQERWVRQGRGWYTRSTGFVTPAPLATLSDQEAH
ncbi:MAG TPA: hypothetical protein VFA18_17635 [Gemmataceae bacterium]|nr:hypothetical protein [Gemmataceae bacterium]